jgi:iron(III) transport system permease protein
MPPVNAVTTGGRRAPDRRLGRYFVVPGILATVGLLVIYPVFFLVSESLNLGDSGAFPPEEVGLDNFRNMLDDAQVLWNTGFVAGLATVMAIGFGLTLSWILTRTAIPGRARLERLMELPYYMTPLVGALA